MIVLYMLQTSKEQNLNLRGQTVDQIIDGSFGKIVIEKVNPVNSGQHPIIVWMVSKSKYPYSLSGSNPSLYMGFF